MSADLPGAQPCPDSWTSYAGAFFDSNCARCHGFEFGTLSQVRLEKVQAAIASARMPHDKVLDPAQKLRILSWYACGAR